MITDQQPERSMWNNAINAWWPLVFYPATDAPRFHRGMIALICVSVATLGVTWLVWYLERREWRIRARESERNTVSKSVSEVADSPEASEKGEKLRAT